MKRIITLATTSFLCLLFACNKNNLPNDNPMAMIIIYTDSSGSPLFKDGQNGYLSDSVYLVAFHNGNKFQLVDSVMSGNNLFYNAISSSIIFPEQIINDNNKGYERFLIHLKTSVVDTIVSHISPGSNPIGFDSTWYNGVKQPNANVYTIVK